MAFAAAARAWIASGASENPVVHETISWHVAKRERRADGVADAWAREFVRVEASPPSAARDIPRLHQQHCAAETPVR